MDVIITLAFTAVMLAAAVSDLRTRRISNFLTAGGVAVALALSAYLGWSVFLQSLAGAGLGLLIGVPLFALGAVGGGDAKLLSAVGAFTGPNLLVPALLASGVLGGVLGLAVIIRRQVWLVVLYRAKDTMVNAATLGRKGERLTIDSEGAVRVPYGVAIALGSLAAWFLPLREWILG